MLDYLHFNQTVELDESFNLILIGNNLNSPSFNSIEIFSIQLCQPGHEMTVCCQFYFNLPRNMLRYTYLSSVWVLFLCGWWRGQWSLHWSGGEVNCIRSILERRRLIYPIWWDDVYSSHSNLSDTNRQAKASTARRQGANSVVVISVDTKFISFNLLWWWGLWDVHNLMDTFSGISVFIFNWK